MIVNDHYLATPTHVLGLLRTHLPLSCHQLITQGLGRRLRFRVTKIVIQRGICKTAICIVSVIF
jgi:hypothetical protein